MKLGWSTEKKKKKIHDEIHNVGILTGKSGPD